MARILVVGVATVDVVAYVDHFPEENSKVRASKREVRRGGNAANTAVVLSRLGHEVSWAGVLVETPDSAVITDDFNRHGVDTTHAHRVASGTPPISCITHSNATGSRTIVHFRDAPEFAFEQFSRIDLHSFDWIHFEGRACDETARMVRHAISARHSHLTISVEAETTRPGIDGLIAAADVVYFSRAFARQRGHTSSRLLLEAVRSRFNGRIAVGAEGECGACALDRNGTLQSSPAFPPPAVIDTVGAGDTLNAGFIHGQLQGKSVSDSLTQACKLAGAKIGTSGFDFAIPC